MPNQTRRRAAGAVFHSFAGPLVMLLSLLAVVWWAPGLPFPEQDSAWVVALNQAVAARLRFGRDVVFNLGPWGAVYTGQFHPATDRMMLAGGTLLALALAAGLIVLARGGRRWLMLLAPLLVATVGLRDPVFVAIPLLLLAVAVALATPARFAAAMRPGPPGAVALLLLVASCALLPLIKGTSGTQAVPMAVLSILALASGRRFRLAAAAIAVFAAGLIGFWLGAGQLPGDLPAYLATAPMLIAGYTEGAALDGPWTDIAAYLAAGALLLWLFWRGRDRRDARGTALLGAGLLFTLFVGFKAGFVRHDEHAMIALGSLALIPLALAGTLRPRPLLLAVVATLCALTFVSRHYPDYRWPSWVRARDRLAGAATGIGARLADPDRLARGYAADMANIRAAMPLAPVTGPSDFYSSGQAILLANGLDWSPRPALQSVTVYSGAMAQADLDHLQGVGGRGGPVRNVFYRVENEDDRLRATQDGLSWPALLGAFDVRGYDRGQEIALLQRRPDALPARTVGPKLLDATARFDQEIPLLAASPGLLWARLDIRPTLAGRLAAFLFRPPILSIAVRFAGGRVETYRLLSGLARGFLLTPHIEDTEDMLLMLLPERRGAAYRPVSIRITGERGTRWLWQRDFRLTLQTMDVPVQPQVRPMLLATPAKLPPEPAATATDSCVIDAIDARALAATPMAAVGSLRVSGWALTSRTRPAVPDTVAVRLTDSAGRAWGAPVQRRVARPDVAAVFGSDRLTDAGFDAALDLRALAGDYTLSIDMTGGTARFVCTAAQKLRIAPTQ